MGIARYNGNISAMTCQYGSESSECGYKFEYDGLNRLTNAFYGEDSALSLNSHRFDEQVTGYDKQGNILRLLRYGRTSLPVSLRSMFMTLKVLNFVPRTS